MICGVQISKGTQDFLPCGNTLDGFIHCIKHGKNGCVLDWACVLMGSPAPVSATPKDLLEPPRSGLFPDKNGHFSWNV